MRMILIILYLIGFIGCETSHQNETDDSLDTFLDPILDTTLNTTEEEKEIVTQERCPYPPPDTIAPCECLADEELREALKTNFNQNCLPKCFFFRGEYCQAQAPNP